MEIKQRNIKEDVSGALKHSWSMVSHPILPPIKVHQSRYTFSPNCYPHECLRHITQLQSVSPLFSVKKNLSKRCLEIARWTEAVIKHDQNDLCHTPIKFQIQQFQNPVANGSARKIHRALKRNHTTNKWSPYKVQLLMTNLETYSWKRKM